jgi:bacillithiol biosynthesis cysteine-adding enzyme BshC
MPSIMTRSPGSARPERRRAPAAVADVLAAQNAGLAPSPARDAHIDALREGAAAVVTGQQVGLFLGPLFTIYKAASAIRVARALAENSDAPVVPVFWLQTEDHDLPEIASVALPGPDAPRRIAVASSPDDRVSLAHLSLPDEVERCLAELSDELAGHSFAADHVARLSRHYRAGAPWAAAFAGVLAELFADEGLVMIDARDPALGELVRPVHRRALVDAEAIAGAMVARCDELRAAGQAVPVHVRPGAPLAFYHPDGPAGPRYRLEAADARDRFAEIGGGGAYTRAELLAALDADPLRFSTSALMRPIVQDTLLPTAAYVGGPAEVAYFAQLEPLYRHFELPPPRVVARARFRIVDRASRRRCEKLGIAADDSMLPEDALLARCRRDGDARIDAATFERRLMDAFDGAAAELAPAAEAAGSQLVRRMERTRAGVAHAVHKLAAAYQRALLHGDEELVSQVARVRTFLYPEGAPQERVYGLPYFAARFGDRHIVERVIAAVEPFDPALRDLHP